MHVSKLVHMYTDSTLHFSDFTSFLFFFSLFITSGGAGSRQDTKRCVFLVKTIITVSFLLYVFGGVCPVCVCVCMCVCTCMSSVNVL